MSRFSKFHVHAVLLMVLASLSFCGSHIVEAQDKRLSEIVAADGAKLR